MTRDMWIGMPQLSSDFTSPSTPFDQHQYRRGRSFHLGPMQRQGQVWGTRSSPQEASRRETPTLSLSIYRLQRWTYSKRDVYQYNRRHACRMALHPSSSCSLVANPIVLNRETTTAHLYRRPRVGPSHYPSALRSLSRLSTWRWNCLA